jgi:hypothetical protein
MNYLLFQRSALNMTKDAPASLLKTLTGRWSVHLGITTQSVVTMKKPTAL